MTHKEAPTKFLLIEDDDDHAELIKLSMETNATNTELYRVRNGDDGIAFLKQVHEFTDSPVPDVVLLDLNMPKINGHDVIRFIKNDDVLKSIPVIVLTTSNAEQDKALAFKSNANSYVVKPSGFSNFQTMVHDLQLFWSQWNESPFIPTAP
ncbi:MAG: response regulator [Phycisphaerales bacterium]